MANAHLDNGLKRFLVGFGMTMAAILLTQTGVLIYWVGQAEVRITQLERWEAEHKTNHRRWSAAPMAEFSP